VSSDRPLAKRSAEAEDEPAFSTEEGGTQTNLGRTARVLGGDRRSPLPLVPSGTYARVEEVVAPRNRDIRREDEKREDEKREDEKREDEKCEEKKREGEKREAEKREDKTRGTADVQRRETGKPRKIEEARSCRVEWWNGQEWVSEE
jgi:hypothetical protein